MNAPASAEKIRTPVSDRTVRSVRRAVASAGAPGATLADLTAVPAAAWDALAARAIEPNAYYERLWAMPVAQHARGRGGALALLARHRTVPDRLIGLMPVRRASRALSIPLPMLVSWNAYATLSVPLFDRDVAVEAAGGLIDAARAAGARALMLQGIATGGSACAALRDALAERGLQAETLRSFRRAALDATQDPETVLRLALSAKKLKELRRQRHRLEDTGTVSFQVATTPDEIRPALEAFLALEARGWKGSRGTALVQHEGDAAFIREAAPALAARGKFEIASLTRNGETLAAGLILRDTGRAFFFKIAMDENEAHTSPGVQLTLDLTRYFCADPRTTSADSSADGEHPMIDHVWRERIEIGDLFVPLLSHDPVAAACKAAMHARYRAVDLVRTIRRIRESLS